MIRESDRHLAAFRGAEGKLWENIGCEFRPKRVPSAFANYVGRQLMPVKMKGVRNWLDDIIIPTATLEEQFALLLEVLDPICRVVSTSTSNVGVLLPRGGMVLDDNRLPWYVTGIKQGRRHHPTLTTNGGRCPGSAWHGRVSSSVHSKL